MTGANVSTQYVAVVAYPSFLTGEEETIKIEVGLREPLLIPPESMPVGTLLLDPVSNTPMVPPVTVPSIARLEAYAEKFRAALSRRDVAIRDFFDIDHAVRNRRLQADDEDLIRLVRNKLDVPGNEPVNVAPQRLARLQLQLEPQLKPVLREKDFREFDLARAFRVVSEMAKPLDGSRS
jgi:hypothetical protein